MTAENRKPVLRMQNIHAQYRGIEALKGASFDLFPGEVHALVGEHGAGKTTLVMILSGAIRKTRGEIVFKDRKIEFFTPQSAIREGIGMVYQDIHVIPTLNAVDNIFAGRMEKTWYGRIDFPLLARKAETLFGELGVSIDIRSPLTRLSREDQYIVELARMLSFDPRLLIFDEISNKLTPEKMEVVYRIIRDAKRKHKSVIYISHNMDEIFRFADRVTVLKNGYRRGTEAVRELDRIKLIKLTYSFVMSREELEKVNIKLHYFKQYNEAIIQNLPVGVVILDSKNKIYMINQAAIKILNAGSQRIAQSSFGRLLRSKAALPFKEEIMEKIRAREAFVWDEVALLNEKFLKVSMYPFHDDEYFFLGTIILLEDVSRERSMKEYLLRTEKVSSIAELAAGVAHEINNPLGIVQNHLELLKIRKLEPNEMEKVRKIEKEIKRIGDIVKSLLSFAKLNELPSGRVNLVELIDDVAILLGHRIREKGIRFAKEAKDSAVWIVGDESRLRQLLLNLLVNSIEAVVSGGAVGVELIPHFNENYVELAVVDNGCGIPGDIMENIFDPFFSTKAGRTNIGLGLPICQHIVELHQGLISCESKPGESTRFTVRFPLLSGSVLEPGPPVNAAETV
jgi:two-component system sensor histidine kinase AtoS